MQQNADVIFCNKDFLFDIHCIFIRDCIHPQYLQFKLDILWRYCFSVIQIVIYDDFSQQMNFVTLFKVERSTNIWFVINNFL